MDVANRFFSRLRQPEYTGENRCFPCTTVNIGAALVTSGLVGAVMQAGASAAAGVAAALATFALCTALIYFRGYLVPGTPTLTKRYLPNHALAAFGKEPTIDYRADGGIDQEAVLTDIGALEPCTDSQDLCLVEEFRTAWYEEMKHIDDTGSFESIFHFVEVDDGEVDIEQHETSLQVTVNGTFIGVWKSRAAFLADMAAASILADRCEGWDNLEGNQRHELVSGLRLFIDQCPTCGAVPKFGTETVETCCAAREVAAVDCTDCGARLFETPA